jgi:hypothetical protein
MALPDWCLENLDCSWPDDLQAYATRLEEFRFDDMRAEHPALTPEEDAALSLLACYAAYKADAMTAGAAGRTNEAGWNEGRCVALYARLPAWAKW